MIQMMWPTENEQHWRNDQIWLMTLLPLYFSYFLCFTLTEGHFVYFVYLILDYDVSVLFVFFHCYFLVRIMVASCLVLKVGAMSKGFGHSTFFQPENMKFDCVMLLYNYKVLFKGLVHPKVKIPSWSSDPHADRRLGEFF